MRLCIYHGESEMDTLNKKISNKNHGLVLEVSNYSYITGTSLSLSPSLLHTHTNSKHWFTTSFLQPQPDLVIKFVTHNSHYIRHLFYVAMLLTPAQIKPKSFELRRNFFFYLGWVHLFMRIHGCSVASTVLLVPKPFRGRWLHWWTAVWK